MKATMMETANDSGTNRSEADAATVTESAVTAHVGTTGYSHPSGVDLRQQRGCYSQQYES
ncbi:MAG TPA: hypothetical protein VJ756_19990 [Terriglobales bacterium]|nr:hypothetical protein [Terriglobales bacterium]